MAGRGEGAGEGFGLLLPLSLGAEVEVEEGGIQFAANQEPPFLVPPERRSAPPAVGRKSFDGWCCVNEFKCASADEVLIFFAQCIRRNHRQLPTCGNVEMDAADSLPCCEVECK